jgi:SPX domain protein involved in polyphosphate accumulation
MKLDPHTDSSGRYQIRSIYFDNYNDKALREKISGMSHREKYRIRYYNDDPGFIVLEKKIKDNSLTMKYDAVITEADCRRLIDGDLSWMPGSNKPLVQELYVKMKGELLKPRVLVSYIREPYIYAPGNVRVTFDSDIRTSLYSRSFLDPDRQDIPAADSPDTMILEVKYDDYLPEVIQHIVQTKGLRQEAFSKYGACRRFG